MVNSAIIINPTKVTNLQALRDQVELAWQSAGWSQPAWYETTAADAGFGQTKSAVEQGAEVVVVCGGDGTVEACVSVLRGTRVVLGILPAGTGNLLARALSIPLDLPGALKVVTHGTRQSIDVGDADGNTFLVMAGMGLDAQLVGDASEQLKKRIGIGAYIWSALTLLLENPMVVRVTLDDGVPFHRVARCVVAGKVGELPGGFRLMTVSPSDGHLAVAIITARTLRHWLKMAWALFMRKPRVPRLETYLAKKVRVQSTRNQRRQLDGDELEPGKSLSMHVVPRAVTVCVP